MPDNMDWPQNSMGSIPKFDEKDPQHPAPQAESFGELLRRPELQWPEHQASMPADEKQKLERKVMAMAMRSRAVKAPG